MTRVLDSIGEQLPAHPTFVPQHVGAEGPTVYRPFGMRLAVEPEPVASVNVAKLVWDEERQVMLLRDGGILSPAFRHTSTQTSTTTGNQDRLGPDTDTDATGT